MAPPLLEIRAHQVTHPTGAARVAFQYWGEPEEQKEVLLRRGFDIRTDDPREQAPQVSFPGLPPEVPLEAPQRRAEPQRGLVPPRFEISRIQDLREGGNAGEGMAIPEVPVNQKVLRVIQSLRLVRKAVDKS